jgi:hypothetical protein
VRFKTTFDMFSKISVAPGATRPRCTRS